MLVFPNIYQHKVGSFGLKDSTRPGHRRILVFFLVDPTCRIKSTELVPPQDISWRDPDLQRTAEETLPREIADIVLRQIGCGMTLEEAREHRLKLMKERSIGTDTVTEEIFGRPFNLCEH